MSKRYVERLGWVSEWQPIETCQPQCVENYLLWNGKEVLVGWLNDDGWWDSTVPDHGFPRIEPQPTHWMLLPEPPK